MGSFMDYVRARAAMPSRRSDPLLIFGFNRAEAEANLARHLAAHPEDAARPIHRSSQR
jgi:hypothetical protein